MNGSLLLQKIKRIGLKMYKWTCSADYWERRYQSGGDSGAGSYNRLALFKAEILNEFVKSNNISSVIEWGCGDGNQLKLAQYPQYMGIDVSAKAIEICKEKFYEDSSKQFYCNIPEMLPSEIIRGGVNWRYL